jgi:hypothetical protein
LRVSESLLQAILVSFACETLIDWIGSENLT